MGDIPIQNEPEEFDSKKHPELLSAYWTNSLKTVIPEGTEAADVLAAVACALCTAVASVFDGLDGLTEEDLVSLSANTHTAIGAGFEDVVNHVRNGMNGGRVNGS